MPNHLYTGLTTTQLYLKLLAYTKPFWLMFAVGILGNLIFAGSQPLLAELMRYMAGAINVDPRAQWLIPAALIGIFLLRGVGSFMGDYGFASVAFSVVNQLRIDLFTHITYLPSQKVDERNSSELVSRITFDTLQVTQAVTNAVKTFVREGATVIFLLGYLMWINWLVTSVFLFITPILVWMVVKLSRRLRKISRRIQSSMGDITHTCAEMLNNFRVMRIFGGEAYEQQRFHKASNNNRRQNMKMAITSAVAGPVIQLLAVAALAVLIYLALTIMKENSAEDILAYITAAALIPRSMRALANIFGAIQKGIAAADSIFSQLAEAKEADSVQYQALQLKGDISFDDVTFYYPQNDELEERQVAIDNVSFSVQAGQTVAIVGRSGGGKSTLVNLIPRFFIPQQGRIIFDGVEHDNISLHGLRSNVSLVNQSITLFNDTIANNIAYGEMHSASEQDIIAAAKQANAWSFIEQLPDGLNTIVGENGDRLSGGQRQRIAIARALLKDAPILILDEATSALDTESEHYIQQALKTATQGRTTFIIAHRLSTIENADRILVMEQGRLVEQGDHKTLLAQGGHYAYLHRQGFSDGHQDDVSNEEQVMPPSPDKE